LRADAQFRTTAMGDEVSEKVTVRGFVEISVRWSARLEPSVERFSVNARAVHLAHSACAKRRHDFVRAEAAAGVERHGVWPDYRRISCRSG
jgi:hypothetical protein